jgi:hypothetical protein
MDFNVRSDSIDVEQIMEQIRTRIREKRGVDYTEQQLKELAAVKLEKFLDPRGVRSDLLEQFRQHQPRYEPPIVPSFKFEDTTMFETHRGPLRFIRKLLNPILKLFFNPNALVHALHTQSEINKVNLEREVTRENQRRDMDALYFEVIHNLVFELTRTGIEVKNLKMRVESMTSRLEFSERRARALESVVVYKSSDERDEPAAPQSAPRPRSGASSHPQPAAPPSPRPGPSVPTGPVADAAGANTIPAATVSPETGAAPEGPGQRSRRRRRRRGRRGGAPASGLMGPSDQVPSTVREPHGRAEPDRGTTSSGQALSTEQGQAPDVQPPSQPATAEQYSSRASEDHEITESVSQEPQVESQPRESWEPDGSTSDHPTGSGQSASTDSGPGPVTGSGGSNPDHGSDPDHQ